MLADGALSLSPLLSPLSRRDGSEAEMAIVCVVYCCVCCVCCVLLCVFVCTVVVIII